MAKKQWTDRARDRMAKLGVTQKQLAKRMGVSRSMVGHYLTQRSSPPPGGLVIMAQTLGVSLDWLLTGTTKKR